MIPALAWHPQLSCTAYGEIESERWAERLNRLPGLSASAHVRCMRVRGLSEMRRSDWKAE